MPTTAKDLIPVSQITVAPITDEERARFMDWLQPLLDRYGAGAERVPRPNLMDISEVLLMAHAHATSPGAHARWSQIPPALFDGAMLSDLRTFGVAARVVAAALASNDAQSSGARLPVALVDKATALKERVMRYLEYHLEFEPAAKSELASIRSGSGYWDLESDLTRIAVLLDGYRSLLEADKTYRASDAADCVKAAGEIAAELSTTSTKPTALVDGLWMAIRRVYADEVRPTAEWLFRRTPGELVFYPSIFVGFGRPRGSGGDAPAPDAPPATPPVEPPAPT